MKSDEKVMKSVENRFCSILNSEKQKLLAALKEKWKIWASLYENMSMQEQAVQFNVDGIDL